jgi:hypothetical protein
MPYGDHPTDHTYGLGDRERERLAALEAAARKFIEKVENGRARSVETYNELKAALRIR